MTPIISVVIPTHNRSASLARALDLLDQQTAAPALFEVIVAMDGCIDGTTDLIRARRSVFALGACETSGCTGAAGARNLGASLARGRILLFLDDDMEPAPGLVAAHLNAHRNHSATVALGYFPMQAPEPHDDPFTHASRLWWAEEFATRAERGHRFTLKDLCTGNFSLPRSLFEAAGGFDEQIDARGAGEDFELGYRLIELGGRFQFVPEAASIHHTHTPLDVRLLRSRQEGFGQTILVKRHPELYWEFNISRLSRISDLILLRPLWRAFWRWPALAAPPAAILELFVRLLTAGRIYSLLWMFYLPLRGYYYWLGVRSVLGSLADWERLGQDAPVEKAGAREIDVDIARDLERLDHLTESQSVDAVRVWCRGVPVGRIPPWAGAEPLNAVHIRSLLVQHFSGVLLCTLITETGLFRDSADLPRAGSAARGWE